MRSLLPSKRRKKPEPEPEPPPAWGTHKHRCSQGHVWEHSDALYGNAAAHTCPQCKEVVWRKWSEV